MKGTLIFRQKKHQNRSGRPVIRITDDAMDVIDIISAETGAVNIVYRQPHDFVRIGTLRNQGGMTYAETEGATAEPST
jgi:hypothetical protein